MLSAVRKFVRQCPLAAIGIFTLIGTGATTAMVIDIYPPELAREHRLTRDRQLARASKSTPPALELDPDEANFMGP